MHAPCRVVSFSFAVLAISALGAKIANDDGTPGTGEQVAMRGGMMEASVSASGQVQQEPQAAEDEAVEAVAASRRQVMRAEQREAALAQRGSEDPDHDDAPEQDGAGGAALREGDDGDDADAASRRRRWWHRTFQNAKSKFKRDCQWSPWKRWSSCSEACGGGVMTRKRFKKVRAAFGGKDCVGDTQKEEACNMKPCPIDCKWGEWNLWSSCSSTCGGGRSMRYRNVTSKAQHGGRCCVGAANESHVCSGGPCPVACKWGAWGKWGACSKTCGTGSASRTRVVKVQAVGGGKACAGCANETISCNTDPCPSDCKWAEWKPWSACSASCGNGTRTRTRERAKEAKAGGVDCQGNTTDQGTCMDQPCVVDCQWGPWSQWPGCSATCGGGTMERNRSVAVQPSSGGKQCDGSPKESMNCGVVGCPVNCEWTPWGNWSDCTRSCGGGTTSRTRRKALEAANGGTECKGTDNERKPCNIDGCPVDCEWSQWSPWSNCSRPCGGGQLIRRRNVTSAAANGGRVCQGHAEATLPCNTQGCPVDCVWSDWGRWTACTKTCGNGTNSRDRAVKVQPMYGGKACDGLARAVAPCNSIPCPVNCHWAEWGNWTDCSQTCGSGIKSRTRQALDKPQNGGTACPGHSTMQADCNTQACPVDCKWEAWNEWGACPVTCGGATLSRVRAKQEESNGGLPCNGTGNATKRCGEGSCDGTVVTVTPPPNASSNASNESNASSASGASNASGASGTSNASTSSGTSTSSSAANGSASTAPSSSSASSATGTTDTEPQPSDTPANATGGDPRHIVGDVVLSMTDPQAFASNDACKKALASALGTAAGARPDGVTVESLTAASPSMFVAIRRLQSVGLVDGRFKIDTDNITGPVIYSKMNNMNASVITFLLIDALARNGLRTMIVEAVSISVDLVNAPPPEATGSPTPAPDHPALAITAPQQSADDNTTNATAPTPAAASQSPISPAPATAAALVAPAAGGAPAPAPAALASTATMASINKLATSDDVAQPAATAQAPATTAQATATAAPVQAQAQASLTSAEPTAAQPAAPAAGGEAPAPGQSSARRGASGRGLWACALLFLGLKELAAAVALRDA